MASLLKCRVHPVVLLSIIDAHERRPEAKANEIDKVIGTLLGNYEKGVIEITNCYTVPHSEQQDEAQLQISFNKDMYELFKRGNPAEMAVGWFTTHPSITEYSLVYHGYYQQFVSKAMQTREQLPIILLTVDCSPTAKRLAMKAYVRTHAGIPNKEREQCTIFMPVEVEIAAFDSEQVGVDTLFAGVENRATRKVDLKSGVDQIAKVTDDMLHWVEKLKKYVSGVLKGEIQPDADVGRKLMEIISNVNQIQPKQFEDMLSSSMKDYLMIVYLAQLTKTQLTLHENVMKL